MKFKQDNYLLFIYIIIIIINYIKNIICFSSNCVYTVIFHKKYYNNKNYY